MDWNNWEKQLRNARNPRTTFSYRGYTFDGNTYTLGTDMTREDFEAYRSQNTKCYDRGSGVTIRPNVANPTEGFFEYTNREETMSTYDLDQQLLDEFCKEYNIVHREALEELINYFGEYDTLETLRAISPLKLLSNFQ